MNMAHAGHGTSTENPFDSLGKAIAGRSNNMQHAILQSGMQGAQHAHEKDLQINQHGHEVDMAVVGHVLGQDAADRTHGRNVHFFDAVNKHAEGGTPVSMGFGDTKLDYTRKAAKVRAPKAAPAKQQGPQLMGMPINIATSGKPAAPVVAQPKPPVLMANHPVTGSLVRRDSLSAKELAAADAKRAAKSNAKKATVKKAATKKKK